MLTAEYEISGGDGAMFNAGTLLAGGAWREVNTMGEQET